MNKWNFYNNRNCNENDNCNNFNQNCSDIPVCDCDCLGCPPGLQGPVAPIGPQGPIGPRGFTGATGPVGPQGPAGGVLNYADFYALMPPDNAATVAPGTDVSFPKMVLIAVLIFPEPDRIHLILHRLEPIRYYLKLV